MELSYDEIRKIHRLEKNTSQLVEINSTFYDDLRAFLKSEKQKYLESLKNFSVSKTRDFTNLKKMVEEIFSMREKKILNKALISSRIKEVSDENMALHEKKIFKKVLDLLEQHNNFLSELFEGEPAKIAGEIAAIEDVEVEILEDIPPFVGHDMKEYGPFSKGQVVTVPLKVGKLLNSRSLGAFKESSG